MIMRSGRGVALKYKTKSQIVPIRGCIRLKRPALGCHLYNHDFWEECDNEREKQVLYCPSLGCNLYDHGLWEERGNEVENQILEIVPVRRCTRFKRPALGCHFYDHVISEECNNTREKQVLA